MQKNNIIILISNNDYIMEKVFKYNFPEADIITIPESYTPFDREALAKKINKKYTQVIFYGYYDQFYLLLPIISKKVIKKYIIDVGIAKLCDPSLLSKFQMVFEYKERGLIDHVATTRSDLYYAFKNKMHYLQLDYKNSSKRKTKNSIKSVGILSNYYFEESNFYNQLSAIVLSSFNRAIVLEKNSITKKFGEDFLIEIEEEKNIEELIYKSDINLECKLCDISNIYFLISMDAKIPCLLGNTDLLDNCSKLKSYLVLESDDNVNEIKDKIEQAVQNKEEIHNLYLKWRKDFTQNTQNMIMEFIKLK